MQFIKSFSTVTREDYESVGYLAADLALAHENNFRIPLTFVISTDAYHTFLEKNGLKNKLIQIYHNVTTDRQLAEAYESVKNMFLSAELPLAVAEELFEAYHSIGGDGGSADSIINQTPNPRVMLVKSPNYIIEDTDMSGIFLNVQGEEKLVKAVKLCWASLFSPESAGYRLSHNLRMPNNCGIIVQQFFAKGKNAVARAYNKRIDVETYLGIMDTHNELNKDKFSIDREYLQIKEKEIRFQQYRITIEEGKLVRNPLKQEGAEQKLNDKEVMEAARTAKRISNYLNKNSTIHMSLLNEQFMVKLCYRNTTPEPLEYTQVTANEEKLIAQEKEAIQEFEEEQKGEVSETEITIEEEIPETEDIEFVSLDDEKPSIREEIIKEPEVEVYDQQSTEFYGDIKEDKVFPQTQEYIEESEINEPIKVYQEEKPEENEYQDFSSGFVEKEKPEKKEYNNLGNGFIEEEPEIEDFIMSMPDEPIIEESKVEIEFEKEQRTPKVEETIIMQHIRFDASSIIVKVYKELFEAIKRKYEKTFGNYPESFGEGVRDLSQRVNISEQDMLEIKRLRDEYINNNKALTTSEIKFVLDTANYSLSVLIK